MSDMHVIDGDGTRWGVVMHFAMPAGNNAAGITWSTALVNSGMIDEGSRLPDGDGTAGTIDATEKAAVAAGTVYEHHARLRMESGGTTTAQLQSTLRSFYEVEESRIVSQVKRKLRYIGYTESGE